MKKIVPKDLLTQRDFPLNLYNVKNIYTDD